MFNFLTKISNSKRSLIIIGLILIITVLFETLQQLYYMERFNLGSDISFFGLLKTQAYRWFIWFILALALVWFVKKNASKTLTTKSIIVYALFIFSLVFVNILAIAFSQLILSDATFSLALFLKEYVQFFTFQKAPIYSLGYIAITIILYLYFTNEQLQIKVQELSELKTTHANLYNKLIKNIDEKASILNIKIGNKRKIIPTANIRWIEADDYCVKVHTINNDTYTMRSSLKALEEKLNTNFLRVHRNAIVNMSMAKELNLSQTPNLILNNDIEINVSKSNLKTVKDYLS